MRQVKKHIIFAASMFIVAIALVIATVLNLIPRHYDVAAYLLIISCVLFAIYGLLFIADDLNTKKPTNVLDEILVEYNERNDSDNKLENDDSLKL